MLLLGVAVSLLDFASPYRIAAQGAHTVSVICVDCARVFSAPFSYVRYYLLVRGTLLPTVCGLFIVPKLKAHTRGSFSVSREKSRKRKNSNLN